MHAGLLQIGIGVLRKVEPMVHSTKTSQTATKVAMAKIGLGWYDPSARLRLSPIASWDCHVRLVTSDLLVVASFT